MTTVRGTRAAGAAIALAVAAVALAGCTGERAHEVPASVVRSKAAATSAWADAFCGSFRSWLDAVAAAGAQSRVVVADRAAAQRALVDAFARLDLRTAAFATEVDRLGDPPGAGGAAVGRALVERIGGLRRAVAASKVEAEALDPASPDYDRGALEVLARFQRRVDAAGRAFTTIDASPPDPALSRALVRACDF